MSHDYATFELRMFHDGNLWTVNALGNRGRISLQQDWKIAPEYVTAIHNNDNNGEIIVCFCSYPYFYEMTCQTSGNGKVVECCRYVTCLVDDRKREIDSCPDFANSFNDYRSIVEMVKVIQPNVQIIKHSENRITLRGKFISRTGTDDLEYFTEWRLQSASMRNEEESRTYIKPK